MRYIRSILAVLIGLGLIVLVFVLVARGFSNAGQTSTAPSYSLGSYADTDATAQLTIDGPVNNDVDHRSFRLTIGKDSSTFELIQGYQGTVIRSNTYPNNSSAYAVFLKSLDRLGFSRGNTSSALKDERGFCPAGSRFIYQFDSQGSTKFRFWSTSCGDGTFSGQRSAVRQLFYAQIPRSDFSAVTRGAPM